MSNLNIKICSTGRAYKINNKQYEKLEKVILHAKNNMKHPAIYHFLSHIDEPDLFRKSKRDLIKYFNRKLRKHYKNCEQQVPNTLVMYSIEFKQTDRNEIKGLTHYPISSDLLPFLHIHFYVIADCTYCRPDSFPYFGQRALNDIDGLSKARYFKSYKGEIYKNIKDDLDDAFQRLIYIAKTDSKSAEIPYKKTFGASSV